MKNFHSDLEAIIKEAKLKNFPLQKALHFYIHSYETHKRLWGSYKHEKQYEKKMLERASFMKEETLAYIREMQP